MQRIWYIIVCIWSIPICTLPVDNTNNQDQETFDTAYTNSKKDTFFAETIHSTCYKRSRSPQWDLKNIFSTLWDEVVGIHCQLFDWDTFKIFSLMFPVCIGARMIDQNIQNQFYDWHHHKNKHTPPDWCHSVAEWIIAVPITFFGLQIFLGRDDDFRQTNITFLVGMPFVIFGKDIIKNIRFEACLRPWHEKFGCEKRSSGGFPSGHAAEGAYMATLYGLEYGPQAAIPLTLLTVGVSGVFLTCNRHYLSQLLAGVGLGVMYGVAAHKFISLKKFNKDICFGVSSDTYGNPSFKVSYTF